MWKWKQHSSINMWNISLPSYHKIFLCNEISNGIILWHKVPLLSTAGQNIKGDISFMTNG